MPEMPAASRTSSSTLITSGPHPTLKTPRSSKCPARARASLLLQCLLLYRSRRPKKKSNPDRLWVVCSPVCLVAQSAPHKGHPPPREARCGCESRTVGRSTPHEWSRVHPDPSDRFVLSTLGPPLADRPGLEVLPAADCRLCEHYCEP